MDFAKMLTPQMLFGFIPSSIKEKFPILGTMFHLAELKPDKLSVLINDPITRDLLFKDLYVQLNETKQHGNPDLISLVSTFLAAPSSATYEEMITKPEVVALLQRLQQQEPIDVNQL